MKTTTINGYDLAIFKVGNDALHITVKHYNSFNSVKLQDFKEDGHLQLYLYNEFSNTIGKLPEDWHERIVRSNSNKDKAILILIIK